MLSPPLLPVYSIAHPSIVLSITSLSLVWLRCQALAMLSGRVQAEDSERKIERQQLVGGDKLETHTTAHAHPHQLFISWPEQIHIYIDFLNSRQCAEPHRNFELCVRLHISTFTGPHISTTKRTRGREITAGCEIRSLVSVHNQYCLTHTLKLRLGPSGAQNCY